jgi:hypothetical protein
MHGTKNRYILNRGEKSCLEKGDGCTSGKLEEKTPSLWLCQRSNRVNVEDDRIPSMNCVEKSTEKLVLSQDTLISFLVRYIIEVIVEYQFFTQSLDQFRQYLDTGKFLAIWSWRKLNRKHWDLTSSSLQKHELENRSSPIDIFFKQQQVRYAQNKYSVSLKPVGESPRVLSYCCLSYHRHRSFDQHYSRNFSLPNICTCLIFWSSISFDQWHKTPI